MTASMPVKLVDDSDPPNVWVASIKYEFVNGCHVFTSEDVSGLLVTSRDPQKALMQIVPTIQELIKHNHGLNCTVELGHEFKSFEKKHGVSPVAQEERLSLRNTYAVIRKKAA